MVIMIWQQKFLVVHRPRIYGLYETRFPLSNEAYDDIFPALDLISYMQSAHSAQAYVF